MASQSETGTPIYRIVSNQYPPFDGGGAFQWGSRWVDSGRMVIHGASSYSLAVLENLVHWQSTQLPPTLVCVVARIPNSVKQMRVSPKDINDDDACRVVGNTWYDEGKTAILWVPSVVSPYEENVLINQTHKDFTKIKVATPVSTRIDQRLL
jgi:RES domain-containing protein